MTSDPQPDKKPDAAPPKRISVSALLEDAREVILVHQGEDYRLRVTAKGKLLLTK
jgi:hemin uptake protein HemP